MKKTKVLASFAALGLVAAIGIGATLAYFTDKDDLSNTINMGNVSGTLFETKTGNDGDDADPTTAGKQTTEGNSYDMVMPGAELSKDPYVILNADSMDAYLRVKLDINVKDGVNATDEQKAALAALENELDIDTNLWTKGNDGYYYYNLKMSAKGTEAYTENTKAQFFTKVNIPAAWGNDMASLGFQIDIVSELVQADHLAADFLQMSNNKIAGWNISADDIKAAQ